ncbi:glycoside hydrolase family 75 protein [Hypoxylon sp. CI-4A]|nr:glycoside hydrolase family 75 protein [Hypoxylon sp. CI-4A]
MPCIVSVILSMLLAFAHARDIPRNIQQFYDSVVKQRACREPLKTGFYDRKGSADNSFVYCGDHVEDFGIIYLQGGNGKLANMDIDCDGDRTGFLDDTRCGSHPTTQSMTAMKRYVSSYSNGVPDLNPFVHDYVVFGNTGSTPGWVTFDPRRYGMEPLSLMAIVCNDKLIYGVWGDTNGDDGDNSRIGESSISIANLCFGAGGEGDIGHDDEDILYIGFRGHDAVPGESADWQARDSETFQSSIQELGDKLIKRIGGP